MTLMDLNMVCVVFIALAMAFCKSQAEAQEETKQRYGPKGFTLAGEMCSMGIQCGEGHGIHVDMPFQVIKGSPGKDGQPGLPGPAGLMGETGPRGSPGYNGENGWPGEIGFTGFPGLPGQYSPDACQVTFYGIMKSINHSYDRSSITPLIFENVMTNEGNMYNPGTGYFTVPFKATFSFHLNVVTTEAGKQASAHLYVNERLISTVWAGNNLDVGAGSNSYILVLQPDDKICVRMGKPAIDLFTHNEISFSAICLWKSDIDNTQEK